MNTQMKWCLSLERRNGEIHAQPWDLCLSPSQRTAVIPRMSDVSAAAATTFSIQKRRKGESKEEEERRGRARKAQ